MIPQYRLTKSYHFFKVDKGKHALNQSELEQGTYIKPIWNKKFVPEEVRTQWVLSKDDVFCYTPAGIIPIPIDYIQPI